MSPGAVVAVHVVVGLLMVVVLPLGLRLVGGAERLARWWPAAGVAGAASVWLPRGGSAVALALLYTAACTALAVVALRRVVRRRGKRTAAGHAPDGATPAVEVAVLVALTTPLVGAVALLAERAGRSLLGFDLGILSLTVPHMHAAGFAAALVAGLVAREAGRTGVPGRVTDAAALTVPAGTVLVLVGYFVGDWAELVGAVVLTAGMWLVAGLTWTRLRRGIGRAPRALLGTGAGVLAVTMVLALAWAVGEATGLPHPSLDWMVAAHGVANALGFALCGVVGWRLVTAEAL